MRTKPKVSLKDIAEASGVAVTTVSAALNRTGRVSDAMREKILTVSRRMNYEPNLAAQLLKQKHCTDIGLIVSDLPENIAGSGYLQPMIASFIQICDNEGLRCQIEYHNLVDKAEQLPSLLTNGFAGGVLHGGYISPRIREWVQENPHFPFVALEEASTYSIHSSYDTAAYEVVQHFAALGHRRIGMVVGPQIYAMQRKPKEGVLRAVNDFGLDINNGEWIHESAMAGDRETMAEAVAYGMELFKNPIRPTAILAFDVRVAKGLVYAALKSGLSVPEDLSIVGLGSTTESEQFFPALSSITWNAPEAIRNGCHMLRTLMDKRVPTSPLLEIRPIIAMRDSVAKCRTQP